MSLAGLHLTAIGQGRFLLEPGSGLDIGQKDALIVGILSRLQEGDASELYYHLGSVPLIDHAYYDWLDALARSCVTINVRMICVHMQPTAAFALSHMLKGPPSFASALTLDL